MTQQIYKYPRVFLNAQLQQNAQILLGEAQAHYFKNVLRKGVGEYFRVFNGHDGEFLAQITALGKKDGQAVLQEVLRVQPPPAKDLILFFAPIKKQRMDILIEKAVELGVTQLYPVLTNRTENRKLNSEKMCAQIIEAAEQCERMDIPQLHEAIKLHDVLRLSQAIPIYAALERVEAKPLSTHDLSGGAAFLIGPEGGFDMDEIAHLSAAKTMLPVTLGENILRAETAVMACLSYAKLSTKG